MNIWLSRLALAACFSTIHCGQEGGCKLNITRNAVADLPDGLTCGAAVAECADELDRSIECTPEGPHLNCSCTEGAESTSTTILDQDCTVFATSPFVTLPEFCAFVVAPETTAEEELATR